MWGALTRAFGKRAPLGRLHAAELDFKTAAALLELNEQMVSGVRDPDVLPVLHEDLRKRWAESELAQALPYANDSMTIQLAEMFQHLHDVDAGDGVAPARAPRLTRTDPRANSAAFAPSIGPSSHTNPLPTLPMAMASVAAEDRSKGYVTQRRALQERLGYSVWVGPTQAAFAGREAGVFVRGRAAPGAVLALYPGAVFNSESLVRGVDAGHLGNPSVQRTLIPRFDEAVIDVYGRAEGMDGARANVYAVAQHVRHPPRGVAANVMRLQFDFVDAVDGGRSSGVLPFPPHLRPYIPNAWGSDVTTAQALYSSLEADIHMKGSVLIALRPLWDEELFVDVTLNPYARQNGELPQWAVADWDARRDMRRMSSRVSEETATVGRALQLGPRSDVPPSPQLQK
jgi:hypothetical protein